MRSVVRRNSAALADARWRGLAVLMAICLLLSQVSGGFMVAYAANGNSVSFQVGSSVTAELIDGVLTLSGTGDTDDFTAESAPFLSHAADIRELVIEEGVTYLGAHLFSGLGELGGELTLPASIVGFGDCAFSGESSETSPHFSMIRNLFESGEVVHAAEPQAESGQAPSDDGYTIERITQQQIAHPDTLFVQGQAGTVDCSGRNGSFREAALLAGYRQDGVAEGDASADADAKPETGADAETDADAEPETDAGPEADAEATAEPEAMAQAEPVEAMAADAVPVAATGEAIIVYVDQANGSDGGVGTEESPVRTLAEAAKRLTPRKDGGSVETNNVVIKGTYTRTTNEQHLPAVPFTLSGVEGAVFGAPSTAEEGGDHPLRLYEDFCMKNIKLSGIDHIYADGCPLTIGENVTNSPQLYLYGFGQNGLTDEKGEKKACLTVKSGSISRIVGYLRSNERVDCSGYTSTISVGGTAFVSTIVAGSASGEIKNAAVDIDINGGKVTTLVGGNQGFNANPSPYSGKTTIDISGGEVTYLYGAGSGRSHSVPTFLGELGISVSGGMVDNLYGAGSAAYVISDEGTTSRVAVSVSGGQVNNLFAAGKGWETSLTTDTPFAGGVASDKFGSVTGEAGITVSGDATVGNIYASGEGYRASDGSSPDEGAKSNAYLDGTATIRVNGGKVTGNVYGGGKGFEDAGYEQCARVTQGSQVRIEVAGGTVQGSVYGGGEKADVEGSTSVAISDGTVMGKVFGGGKASDVEGSAFVTLSDGATVQGNVYGGGEEGAVEGAATVNVQGGTFNSSVYGGALGSDGKVLVLGGSTVNMTGGWVRGNLYGGSEFSDDGAPGDGTPDLVFTNLVGGTVSGNVFGGGFKGTVNGSTHLHIGTKSLDACAHYQNNPAAKPSLPVSALSVGGSVYAGGDFGGGGEDYDTITVKGTSHVFIDGFGYDTSGIGTENSMILKGGVFGSGASCDAGSTRLVTLENYGMPIEGDAGGATRSLSAIQRADRVLILNTHVKLTGQSDVANTDQTQHYSLNRIGDHGEVDGLGGLKNGLVLQGGSTVILESPAMELAALRSLDASGSETAVGSPSNTLLLDIGTMLRVSYTSGSTVQYGPVKGYTRLLAGDSAEGYVSARISPSGSDEDGGFVDKDDKVISFTESGSDYRYWKVRGEGGDANATRQTVLIARTLSNGVDSEGFAVAKGLIDLPPADAGSTYIVKRVEASNSSLKLVEAAKTGQEADDVWRTSADNADSADSVELEAQKSAIEGSPLSTFGLYMKPGSGFSDAAAGSGKVISAKSMASGPNTVINTQIAGDVTGAGVIPQIEFCLTYANGGITASQDLGTVTVELERWVDGAKQGTTTVNVEIVTRTSNLSSSEIDLYATQTGTYAATLYIPKGIARQLSLTGVEPASGARLEKEGTPLAGNDFNLSMEVVQDQGWVTAGRMEEPCDLGGFNAATPVQIGTTDSRYDAPIRLTLSNAPGFVSKDPDIVKLTLRDESNGGAEVSVTLRIHWEESAVKSVAVGSGRRHNGLSSSEKPAVSKKSAVTAVFSLSNPLQVSKSRFELQTENGSAVALPAGTKLTLLSGAGFYHRTVTEAEATSEGIDLGGFASMGGSDNLSGSIEGDAVVIVDFNSSVSGLEEGDYSLRLRNEGTADSVGADFTVNNTTAKASLVGGDGMSKGAHSFTLSLSAGSDTRFSEGAAVVLASADDGGFPEGARFTFGGADYYPSEGRVHIPLTGEGPWDILMDTSATAGLPEGAHGLVAEVFPTGASAGDAKPLTAKTGYIVGPNPTYGLSVSLSSEENRIVKPGSSLEFAALYTASVDGAIAVKAQEKTAEGYRDVPGWTVPDAGVSAADSGTQAIAVVVPESLGPGTYRLVFTLGDREVPYNLIVME